MTTVCTLVSPCYVYLVYHFTEMPVGRKSLERLPWSVVRKLTQFLDRQFPEHHNWMAFLENAEVVGKIVCLHIYSYVKSYAQIINMTYEVSSTFLERSCQNVCDCITPDSVFLIRSYGAPLAQRPSYLALHSSLFGPDGAVNYDYIVTNFVNWLKMYSQ